MSILTIGVLKLENSSLNVRDTDTHRIPLPIWVSSIVLTIVLVLWYLDSGFWIQLSDTFLYIAIADSLNAGTGFMDISTTPPIPPETTQMGASFLYYIFLHVKFVGTCS